MSITKGAKIIEGKTKIIWAIDGNPHAVVVEHKNTITAYDDPDFTQEFGSKAVHSTSTTSRVFELLRDAGIPVAFQEQISQTEFVAANCKMIPLEVVARRLAVGSYLKRWPNLRPAIEGDPPHRFHRLEVEFFLKTTEGRLIHKSPQTQLVHPEGEVLVEGLDPKTGEEDPFIPNPHDENGEWKLFHPKKPSWNPEADLGKTVKAHPVLSGIKSSTAMEDMEDIMRRVFLVLEGAWNTLGLRLIDMKIEFGITPDGELVVSDVIDNDSWRLRTHDWKELSKQAFRDGEGLNEVERKYGIVAGLVENFRIPKQAVIVWKGSDSDKMGNAETGIPSGVKVETIVLSGHKKPGMVLKNLERIMAQYTDGGVIVVKVGRSNGLGPILAARTSWPVIAIPATLKDFPEDAWSSLRMPSDVPLMTCWPDSNAAQAAINILANKNPVAYMMRQLAIENLDH